MFLPLASHPATTQQHLQFIHNVFITGKTTMRSNPCRPVQLCSIVCTIAAHSYLHSHVQPLHFIVNSISSARTSSNVKRNIPNSFAMPHSQNSSRFNICNSHQPPTIYTIPTTDSIHIPLLYHPNIVASKGRTTTQSPLKGPCEEFLHGDIMKQNAA